MRGRRRRTEGGLSSFVHWSAGAVVVAAAIATGCEPTIPIGQRVCRSSPDGPGEAQAPVELPWETGFEDGLCDYERPIGFCFATGSGSFSIVQAPVHRGKYAAAFTVTGNVADAGGQARCVRQGQFPEAAYYGAWYCIPASAQNNGNWNLFHYQGGLFDASPEAGLSAMWDVSLASAGDGGLNLYLLNLIPGGTQPGSVQMDVPIGRWFHIEVYFRRAKDSSGEFTLFQDGRQLVDVTGIQTDTTDWGQWYVGNLANALQPPLSTIYVDDVSISAAL